MTHCLKGECAYGKRASLTTEWNDGKKDRIYCRGRFDRMTEKLLDECFACRQNVNKAQDDLDEWNRRIYEQHKTNRQDKEVER